MFMKGPFIRSLSTGAARLKDELVLRSHLNGVTTLTMNNPKKLNGWTGPMMLALRDSMSKMGSDSETKVGVVTGTDPYYCAGVNLSDSFRPMHPAKLHKMIVENNAAVFNTFIDFPKPLLVAVNGPAIGASVTSATLADAIVASEKASFNVPFARLAITPEGCSSVHFDRIMGAKNKERIIGAEGWVPTAAEAKEIGFVMTVTKHEDLMKTVQETAEKWIKEKRPKKLAQGHGTVEEYRRVNMEESLQLADAFLSPAFLEAQQKFLKSKGKTQLAYTFWLLRFLRPLWIRTLPKKQ